MVDLKPQSRLGHNRLLDALPKKDRASVIAKTEKVSLGIKQMLYEMNEPIRDAYFLLSGVASMISVVDGDTFLEVGTIGNEGIVGVPIVLGAERIPFRAFAQVPGEALKISAVALREEIARSRPLQDLVQRYLQALFTQLGQSVACNRLHSIEQRFARWMLTTCDRVESEEFPITQEFIAMMLGARRAGVNQVAVKMQQAGLIRYKHGTMEILDPPGLEERACMCYQIIRQEYDDFLKDGWADAGN